MNSRFAAIRTASWGRVFIVLAMAGTAVLAGAADGDAQAQTVTLQRKFDVKAYKTKETSKVAQVMSLAGMDVETGIDSTSVNSYTLKPGTDGMVMLAQKTDEVKASYSLPMGMSFEFDSKNPKKVADNPQVQPILDLLGSLSKAEIVFTIDPKTAKVVSATGGEKVLDSLAPETKAMAESQLAPDKLKEAHEQEFAFLPDKPVAPKDTWTKSEVRSLGSGQSLTMEVIYTYEGSETKGGKTVDKITGEVKSVKFKMEGEAQGISITNSDLKVNKGTTTHLFDSKAGLVVESKSDITIEGTMTLSAGGMDIPTNLTLNLSGTTELLP